MKTAVSNTPALAFFQVTGPQPLRIGAGWCRHGTYWQPGAKISFYISAGTKERTKFSWSTRANHQYDSQKFDRAFTIEEVQVFCEDFFEKVRN